MYNIKLRESSARFLIIYCPTRVGLRMACQESLGKTKRVEKRIRVLGIPRTRTSTLSLILAAGHIGLNTQFGFFGC